MIETRVRIGDIGRTVRGVTYEKRDARRHPAAGYVPLLRATNIDGTSLTREELVYVPSQVVSEEQLLREGDIVLAASSGSLAVVGKAALFRGGPQTTFGAFCYVVRPSADFVLPDYLARFMETAEYRGGVSKLAAGVNINNLRREHIEEFTLPLTGIASQRRIVEASDSYVSRLESAVASLESAQRKLKAYRASVLKAAVEGRLVPTEAALASAEKRDFEPADVLLKRILAERRRRWEEAELAKLRAAGKAPTDDRWKAKYVEPDSPDGGALPDLPAGWCWASVDQVGEVLLGRQRAPQYLTGRWPRPYLRVANIKDDRIDFDDIEEMDFDPTHFEKYRVAPGDILVSEGQSPHLVGQSAIYRGGIKGLCFQKTLHRFRSVEPGPCSEFAQLVFRAHVRTRVFQNVASITTNIAHLTLEKFKESRFPLPPQAEQERILSEAQRLLSVADAVEAQVATQLARIARLRQAVLKVAFEGKLVDQNPSDEPAEKLLARIRAERAKSEKPKKARRARVAG